MTRDQFNYLMAIQLRVRENNNKPIPWDGVRSIFYNWTDEQFNRVVTACGEWTEGSRSVIAVTCEAEKVLDQLCDEITNDLLKLVCARPGIELDQIKGALGLEGGQAAYHIVSRAKELGLVRVGGPTGLQTWITRDGEARLQLVGLQPPVKGAARIKRWAWARCSAAINKSVETAITATIGAVCGAVIVYGAIRFPWIARLGAPQQPPASTTQPLK